MATTTTTSTLSVWSHLQEIERTIFTKYQHPPHPLPDSVRVALEDLKNAVRTAPEKFSSLDAMITTRVVKQCMGVETMMYGGDYLDLPVLVSLPQPSVNETLLKESKLSFYDIKEIQKIRPTEIQRLLTKIVTVVEVELKRLASLSVGKVKKIESSLDVLKAATAYKYAIQIDTDYVLNDDQKLAVSRSEIYTYGTMLDLRVGELSLRQSLNLSTRLGSQWEVVWGKATALINVENSL